MREMRRKDRMMNESDALDLLKKGEYGFLATVNKDGQPYGIALNYVLIDSAICFHCAKSGQKIENIEEDPRVCFTVVGRTQPVYDGSFGTFYESTVVYGKGEKVTDEEEKNTILYQLSEKYLPEFKDHIENSIKDSSGRTDVYKIMISHISGKARKQKA